MKIEITGSRCVTCRCYTQYYQHSGKGEYEAIDCGYCGWKAKNMRPGDRCKDYCERPNVRMQGA